MSDPQAVIADPRIDAACQALAKLALDHFAASDRLMRAKPRGHLLAPRLMAAVYTRDPAADAGGRLGAAAPPRAHRQAAAIVDRAALLPVRMTSSTSRARVHVVGAGLAGLSAAVVLASRGVPVVLRKPRGTAGGRCRSFRDSQLGMMIDNGNHLVLSGNPAVARYLAAIGAQDHLQRPFRRSVPLSSTSRRGRRWTLRPNDGPIPWWILAADRRVPDTAISDYLALATLMRRHRGQCIADVLPCRGVLWDKFLRPLLVSVLNTPPEEGSADLAGAVMRETFARGGRAIRPRIAAPSLDEAFIEPALRHLRRHGVDIQLGRRLVAIKFRTTGRRTGVRGWRGVLAPANR